MSYLYQPIRTAKQEGIVVLISGKCYHMVFNLDATNITFTDNEGNVFRHHSGVANDYRELKYLSTIVAKQSFLFNFDPDTLQFWVDISGKRCNLDLGNTFYRKINEGFIVPFRTVYLGDFKFRINEKAWNAETLSNHILSVMGWEDSISITDGLKLEIESEGPYFKTCLVSDEGIVGEFSTVNQNGIENQVFDWFRFFKHLEEMKLYKYSNEEWFTKIKTFLHSEYFLAGSQF